MEFSSQGYREAKTRKSYPLFVIWSTYSQMNDDSSDCMEIIGKHFYSSF
ncbi:hypothetical protein LZZ85_05605 [Terrimonas sp. NA20]|uniref:Uncharacterized protein n=1 Tax=Terrimonas ginsenosidimutans TaxID=2908004 RepID=A0ABS9KN39_9BACT|nr:hypothetical protein [Terrimonas ginsenosidimutans]MCG2613743.1 hypothetical protein [Terrimonas ginsenosidimutans]